MLLKLTLQWIILCRLLKGGMQLRLKTLLYDAGCSSEEFLTRRSWKLVCFTQIPDVVFTHTKRTNAKLYIHIHPTSLVVGGLVPGAHLWGCWSQLLKTRSGVSSRAPRS